MHLTSGSGDFLKSRSYKPLCERGWNYRPIWWVFFYLFFYFIICQPVHFLIYFFYFVYANVSCIAETSTARKRNHIWLMCGNKCLQSELNVEKTFKVFRKIQRTHLSVELIHELMTLMSWLFLVHQKHTAQPVQSDSWSNPSLNELAESTRVVNESESHYWTVTKDTLYINQILCI